MRVCEYCGNVLSNQAAFCGQCGRTPTSLPEGPTMDLSAVQLYNNEQEEEERRRAALPGLGMIDFVGEGQLSAGTVPMVQGNPQPGSVPSVQGTPPFFAQQGGQAAPPLFSAPTWSAPQYAPPAYPQPAPIRPPLPHRPTSPHHSNPTGCAPAWLVLLFVAILIITSVITLGLTVLTPNLSTLNGSTDIDIGGSLHIHGNSFIPGSGVSLTLDGTTPLYFTSSVSPVLANGTVSTLLQPGLAALPMARQLSSSNIVTVGGNGTFTVTITIDQSWHTGQHTIRAAEKISLRSATLTIHVHQPGTLPTSTATDALSPIASDTPLATDTPSVTPSATASSTTTLGLSCANPTAVSLGPVSESYTQAVSAPIVLCANGSGLVNWTASWNTQQAPWLQLDHNRGQIPAPGQQQISVSALASSLKAGAYTANITFSSQQSSTTETVNVTFTVQTGCISTSQQRYSFTGIAGVSDPQTQTVTLADCATVGTWKTSISTNNKLNWLSVTPTSGALNNNGTQTVTITASNLHTNLTAGSYSGQILFNIGSSQALVYVTLTVQPGPQIIVVSPNPPSFNASTQCSFDQQRNVWICIASISNSSKTLSLSWKASSSGVPNITFKPSSDTLPPGGGERVIITVPQNNCQTATTLTFTGPANTQNILWSCR